MSKTTANRLKGKTSEGSNPSSSAVRKDVDGIHYVLHEDEFYVWCPKCMTPTYFQLYARPPRYCRQCEDVEFFDLYAMN